MITVTAPLSLDCNASALLDPDAVAATLAQEAP